MSSFWESLVSSKNILTSAWNHNPVRIYLLKVNNGNTRKMFAICSKLTINILEWRYWHRLDLFIVKFEQNLHMALIFPLFTLSK